MPPEIDLDALQKLCDATTPGPWDANWLGSLGRNERDAQFIAAVRTALPSLIERVRNADALAEAAEAVANRYPWEPYATLRRALNAYQNKGGIVYDYLVQNC